MNGLAPGQVSFPSEAKIGIIGEVFLKTQNQLLDPNNFFWGSTIILSHELSHCIINNQKMHPETCEKVQKVCRMRFNDSWTHLLKIFIL